MRSKTNEIMIIIRHNIDNKQSNMYIVSFLHTGFDAYLLV